MTGVCFRRETKGWLQDQWSFVFSNFGITEIWERGFEEGDGEIYQSTIAIDTAAELPLGRSLVIIAPKAGKYIQGEDSLIDFTHPEDAIYVFGGSHANLNDEDDLGGRIPSHKVYIPTVEYEMYSHSAAYIVLYDRLVKNYGQRNNGQ